MASNRIVHFEIPADQPEALVKFYQDLFGWQIHKTPTPGIDYWFCQTGDGPGIDGAIMPRMSPQHCLVNYVNVDNMDAMLDKAQKLGAKLIVPKAAVPNMGWYAVALDPQNNPLGFWQSDPGAK